MVLHLNAWESAIGLIIFLALVLGGVWVIARPAILSSASDTIGILSAENELLKQHLADLQVKYDQLEARFTVLSDSVTNKVLIEDVQRRLLESSLEHREILEALKKHG